MRKLASETCVCIHQQSSFVRQIYRCSNYKQYLFYCLLNYSVHVPQGAWVLLLPVEVPGFRQANQMLKEAQTQSQQGRYLSEKKQKKPKKSRSSCRQMQCERMGGSGRKNNKSEAFPLSFFKSGRKKQLIPTEGTESIIFLMDMLP